MNLLFKELLPFSKLQENLKLIISFWRDTV